MRNKLLCLLLAGGIDRPHRAAPWLSRSRRPPRRTAGLDCMWSTVPRAPITISTATPTWWRWAPPPGHREVRDPGLPREVLLGVEDPDTGDLTFPGLTGYSLFIRHKQEDYGPVTQVVSNMSPGEEGTTINSSDQGTAETASGVIWWGPPLDAAADWDPNGSPHCIWHAYNVFETADGQVYLDGSGNSYGGGGSGMGFSSDATYTYTENGESRTDSISVSVWVSYTPRLTGLRVVEFGEDNSVVKTTDLPLTEDLPALVPTADTAFLIVEEESGEGVKRTLYSAKILPRSLRTTRWCSWTRRLRATECILP